MDKNKVIQWGKWIVARGTAWALATYLGIEAVKADGLAETIAAGLGAVALGVWAAVDDYRGRQKIHAD